MVDSSLATVGRVQQQHSASYAPLKTWTHSIRPIIIIEVPPPRAEGTRDAALDSLAPPPRDGSGDESGESKRPWMMNRLGTSRYTFLTPFVRLFLLFADRMGDRFTWPGLHRSIIGEPDISVHFASKLCIPDDFELGQHLKDACKGFDKEEAGAIKMYECEFRDSFDWVCVLCTLGDKRSGHGVAASMKELVHHIIRLVLSNKLEQDDLAEAIRVLAALVAAGADISSKEKELIPAIVATLLHEYPFVRRYSAQFVGCLATRKDGKKKKKYLAALLGTPGTPTSKNL